MSTVSSAIRLNHPLGLFEAFLIWGQRVLKNTMAIIIFFTLWEVSPRLGLVDATFLPPFSEVLATGWTLILNGQLIEHVAASLTRSLIGYSIALIFAIPLGLLIGWYQGFANALNPLLEMLRNTAALALLPVFILLLGIGEASKIALVIYACSWPLLLNTISGVRTVDPLLIKSARTMGLSPLRLFQKVILPASVPTIFVGVRLAGTFSVLVLVAAEMVGAKAGLGYLIIYSQYNFQIPHMYVGILTITVVGLGITAVLTWVEGYFSAWKIKPGE
jgi:NitT/TauT family transport system permease protein